MIHFLPVRLQRGDVFDRSTRCGHLLDGSNGIAEQDDVLRTPRGPAQVIFRRRDHLSRTTSSQDLLDFSIRKEADPLVVRRPEWIGRTIGSRDRPRLRVVHRPQPQHRPVVSLDCDEHQCTSVGRERELSRRNRRVRCGRKVGARGRQHREARDFFSRPGRPWPQRQHHRGEHGRCGACPRQPVRSSGRRRLTRNVVARPFKSSFQVGG
jgi:hypothetical protein